jgi:hypothetical protein
MSYDRTLVDGPSLGDQIGKVSKLKTHRLVYVAYILATVKRILRDVNMHLHRLRLVLDASEVPRRQTPANTSYLRHER